MFHGIQKLTNSIQALSKILQGRTFNIIACEMCISPGFFQAPKPPGGVAIAFCAPAGLGDDDSNGLSADDRTAILRQWCSLCRRELDRFHGFECKEVDAIAFSSSVQATLRKNPGEWILTRRICQ